MSAARRPALGGRREAREQALLLLYEYEVRGGDLDEVIGDRSEGVDSYTLEVVRGVQAELANLDAEITNVTGCEVLSVKYSSPAKVAITS